MTLTKTFRRSGLLVLAGVVLLLIASAGASGKIWKLLGAVFLVFGGPVFAVSAFRHLMRRLLWRVGSRLLVSYLLLVVPYVFLLGVVYAGAWLVAAQVAGNRLERALERLTGSLQRDARRLADGFGLAASPAGRRRLFDETTSTFSGRDDLGYAYQPPGAPEETLRTPKGTSLLPRPWIPKGSSLFLAREGGGSFLAAIESRPQGTLVLTLQTGPALRAALERDLGMQLDIRRPRPVTADRPSPGTPKARLKLGTQRYDLEAAEESPGPEAPTAAPPKGAGPISGRWILYPVSIAVDAVDWATGQPLAEERALFILHSSVAVEAANLFGEIRIGASAAPSADVAVAVMRFLGGAAAVVFVLAVATAAVLALRIARATRRLSKGVAEIEKGNFAHRVALKGDDQLARLVRGFNDMASHLEASVSERAAKQALEHELQVARDLQRRLLPPPDFTYPGVEIAIDFHPAAAIGGDFYDLLSGAPPGLLTAVLADVSGHGLPTGIVMASAKASLTALARSGFVGTELLALLDTEIARTTDSRTFVTMAYLRFFLSERRVEYTNAGHLYPYRVTPAGAVTALVNPARPLGLGLPATFRTVTAPLDAGDLWVLLSDGIVEAMRPGSDEEFGFARLESLLTQAKGGSAAEARDRVLAAWRDFTGGDEPVDDRTLIVLKIGSTVAND